MLNRQPSKLNSCRYVKPLTTVHVTIAQAEVTCRRPKKELKSHADTCAVGNNCLVVHDHDRPVNVYSYNPKDGYKCAQTVNPEAI